MVFGGNHLNVHPEAATLREAEMYKKLAKELPKKFEKQTENLKLRHDVYKNQRVRNLIHEHDRLTGELYGKRIGAVRPHVAQRLKDITKELEKERDK